VLGDHILDLILLGLIVLFAVSGYRQGFIVGLLSFVGFVGGGVCGALIAPPIARTVIAFLAATLGQLLASSLGAVIRNRVTGNNARAADAAGGAIVSVVSLLVVAWFIGSAVSNSPFSGLRGQVANSEVLRGVDDVMPDAVDGWFSSFRGFVAKTEFPQVFGGLGGESLVNVPPPDTSVLTTPELRAARRSIVKIVGTAPSCQRRIEGSGFVYAPERVMTNAHVVAGVRDGPTVYVMGGAHYRARVVVYNPRRDIAVLEVPGLDQRPLAFNPSAKSRDNAVVAGFPRGHPGFVAVAARVRTRQFAKGPDIYHAGQVKREIYAIRGIVEPGNSGGPLLASDGTVYGVIFAAALTDKETGYALTATEVAPDARTGINANDSVSTQACSD
jgi:S1-C subfamily serine protease